MTVQEIIEAIKNDNLRSNVPFHFVALDKDKGGVAEYGKSSCLEGEYDELFNTDNAKTSVMRLPK